MRHALCRARTRRRRNGNGIRAGPALDERWEQTNLYMSETLLEPSPAAVITRLGVFVALVGWLVEFQALICTWRRFGARLYIHDLQVYVLLVRLS